MICVLAVPNIIIFIYHDSRGYISIPSYFSKTLLLYGQFNILNFEWPEISLTKEHKFIIVLTLV
jgi:hypothetical protein